GDEVQAHATMDGDGNLKTRQERLNDYAAAVRAYVQLATVLRAQGMSEQADRFAYRAQTLQRAHYRLKRRYGRWLFSWVLFLLAGYGYRPGRSLLWYGGVLAGFAVLYLLVGSVLPACGGVTHSLNPVEAAVFSLTSFHGRGFFPGGLELDDPVV